MGYFAMRGFVRVLERETGDRRMALEIAARILDKEVDFEHGGFRVIRENYLRHAVREYIESDNYVVGCFYPWILADASGINQRVFEVLQEKEEFGLIGEIMEEYTNELVGVLLRADPMELFATYDGDYTEIQAPSGATYYVARTE